MRAGLCAAALCAGVGAGATRLHGPSPIPSDWSLAGGAVDLEQELPVVASVRMRDGAKQALNAAVERASTPGSPQYLRHLSWAEVGDTVRPPAERTERVRKWLVDSGARKVDVHPHGDSVKAVMSLRALEQMTNGTFRNYRGEGGSIVARSTGGVEVTPDVADALRGFHGFRGFPLAPAKLARSPSSAGDVNPGVFAKNYGVSTVTKSGKTNIQALAQFQGQYVDKTDLSNFCEKYVQDTSVRANCKIAKYIGENQQGKAGVESMLDSEYMIGLGQGSDTWVFSYPNFDFCGDLVTWGGDVMKNATFPWTISLSYGSQKTGYCGEQLDEISTSVTKMAAAGVSVFASSGDDGSGHATRQGTNTGKVAPSFLSSLPHITAVGSTYWVSGTSGTEQATTQFGSGGGFSYDFQIADASWQKDAVSAYLGKTQHPEDSLSYATNGRGTPDVATLGESFTVIANGQTEGVGGTSASSPSFAAMVTLLNEVCLTHGGTTLGFLNPFLYDSTKCSGCFTDITKGTSAIGSNQVTGVWKAEAGWDACTGLGVPQFQKMLTAVEAQCKSVKR